MKNSIKRFSKQRHAAFGHDFHDLDSVTLQLADIKVTPDDNQTAIVPINNADSHQDDFDRLMVDACFEWKLPEEPQQQSFALVEEVAFGDRIQPVMDFPLSRQPADHQKSAANQPMIDHCADHESGVTEEENIHDKPNGIEPNNPSVMAETCFNPTTELDLKDNWDQPANTHVEDPLPTARTQIKQTSSSPFLFYLLVLLVCALLASTGFLGYMVFEIKMELEQLNQHLTHVGNTAP